MQNAVSTIQIEIAHCITEFFLPKYCSIVTVHQILIELQLFKDRSSMISFPATSSCSFHLIKLLFICCWIERRCGEKLADLSVCYSYIALALRRFKVILCVGCMEQNYFCSIYKINPCPAELGYALPLQTVRCIQLASEDAS